ncbi:MAG TPA: molybdopterin-dependent oxidoreductase, partial [Gammaproteobacteria bacterium]
MANIKTTCPYCGVGCGLIITNDSGGITIAGDPEHPANLGRLCSKGAALGETLDLDNRLLHPQVDGHATDWETALGRVASRLTSIIAAHGPDAVAFYVSGQLLTEDYYVANKLMKGFIGSANIDTNSRLCMSSAVAAYKRAFGSDTVPCSYEDLERAKLIVLTGSNTAWCHPVIYQRIARAKRDNPEMRVVVIDPRRTATCDIADLHLPLKPGSDAVLFNGLLAWLDQQYERNPLFTAHCCDEVETALAAAQASAPSIESVAAQCALPAENITHFYQLFADTERVVTLYSQGINQSSSGTDKANAIINCHLFTGRI